MACGHGNPGVNHIKLIISYSANNGVVRAIHRYSVIG